MRIPGLSPRLAGTSSAQIAGSHSAKTYLIRSSQATLLISVVTLALDGKGACRKSVVCDMGKERSKHLGEDSE